MPFEVYPIEPLSISSRESSAFRGANKVAEQGGHIIAQHELTYGGSGAYGTADQSRLFLVAEIPEAPSVQ